MSWWDEAPVVDPMSASAGRAALERSDPRFSPPRAAAPAENDSWWKMAPMARSIGEQASRIATAVPQGINTGLYQAATAFPDMSAWLSRNLGLVAPETPPPSEAVHQAGRDVREETGVTYTPNITPETEAERVALRTGEAIGGVAATAIPGGIVANTVRPAVAGMRAAPTTYGQTVAQTLATNPGMQVGANVAGNVTGELTDNPYIGLATSLLFPAAAHAVKRTISAAPAQTGAEAERRALLIDAQKEKIPVSFGKAVDSKAAQFGESVLSKLPFVGGRQAALNESAKAAFNKAALDKVPALKGQKLDAATPGVMEQAFKKVSDQFEDLTKNTELRVDSKFAAALQGAEDDMSQQLVSQIPKSVWSKLQELKTAAATMTPGNVPGKTLPVPNTTEQRNVFIDGRTYQNIRSKLSAQLSSAQGNDKRAVGQIIEALDDLADRSIPKEMMKEWKDARRSWRVLSMIDGAVRARHGGESAVGNIPPGALDVRAGKDPEMRRLSQIGMRFVGDKVPDSGTAMRQAVLNAMGIGAGGGLAAGGAVNPYWAAAATGAGYGADVLLNNPATRALLARRYANPSDPVLTKGLAATLAAQQAAQQER